MSGIFRQLRGACDTGEPEFKLAGHNLGGLFVAPNTVDDPLAHVSAVEQGYDLLRGGNTRLGIAEVTQLVVPDPFLANILNPRHQVALSFQEIRQLLPLPTLTLVGDMYKESRRKL